MISGGWLVVAMLSCAKDQTQGRVLAQSSAVRQVASQKRPAREQQTATEACEASVAGDIEGSDLVFAGDV
jgi:hypothetical protein